MVLTLFQAKSNAVLGYHCTFYPWKVFGKSERDFVGCTLYCNVRQSILKAEAVTWEYSPLLGRKRTIVAD